MTPQPHGGTITPPDPTPEESPMESYPLDSVIDRLIELETRTVERGQIMTTQARQATKDRDEASAVGYYEAALACLTDARHIAREITGAASVISEHLEATGPSDDARSLSDGAPVVVRVHTAESEGVTAVDVRRFQFDAGDRLGTFELDYETPGNGVAEIVLTLADLRQLLGAAEQLVTQ